MASQNQGQAQVLEVTRQIEMADEEGGESHAVASVLGYVVTDDDGSVYVHGVTGALTATLGAMLLAEWQEGQTPGDVVGLLQSRLPAGMAIEDVTGRVVLQPPSHEETLDGLIGARQAALDTARDGVQRFVDVTQRHNEVEAARTGAAQVIAPPPAVEPPAIEQPAEPEQEPVALPQAVFAPEPQPEPQPVHVDGFGAVEPDAAQQHHDGE